MNAVMRTTMMTSFVLILSRGFLRHGARHQGYRGAVAAAFLHQKALFSTHVDKRTGNPSPPLFTALYYLHNGQKQPPPFADTDGQETVTTVPTAPYVSTPVAAPLYKPLDVSQLSWKCPPEYFDFKTTEDLKGLSKGSLLNQERATTAIDFGLGMKQNGYNLYVLGPTGSGKRTMIRNFLEERSMSGSSQATTCYDWAYVHNFEQPYKPRAIKLPAGMGLTLKEDLKHLIEDIQVSIPAAIQSDQHRQLVEAAKKSIFDEQNKAIGELTKLASKYDLSLIKTKAGLALAGLVDDMPEKDLDQDHNLKPEKRKELDESIRMLQPMVESLVNRFPKLHQEANKLAKKLNEDVATKEIESLLEPLRDKYKDMKDVLDHLYAIQGSVVEHASDIRSSDDIEFGDDQQPSSVMELVMQARRRPVPFHEYQINLLVDNNANETAGPPVIYEENPLYYNLIGKTEHISQFGMLSTDFSLIKPGSLHRANGGYLVVNARDLLLKPFAWEGLKRCLRSNQINIEPLSEEYGIISTVSIRPEPIPLLDVKVVLLGDRNLYYLLCELDPEFNDLFKVQADFDDVMDLSKEACQSYADLLATLSKDKGLKALDPTAVCAMIEHSTRLAGDQEKLSTHMRSTVDLLCEADYYASIIGDDGSSNNNEETEGTADSDTTSSSNKKALIISKEHVQKAIEQQVYRSDRIRELIYEQIKRGTILLDIEGSKVGQINGLAVLDLGGGGFSFGRPSRITATARLGTTKGGNKVMDIEREVELSGPSHSKGVMILSSFLSSNYGRDFPLSLSANLVFEQSYGMIDGDSASMAELCALLSALSEIPIKQNFAITGSVNQLGEAQAIGGATQKIEGFFDVCKAKGEILHDNNSNQEEVVVTHHGVLIPESNRRNLMLRHDVLEAVEEGKFDIYTYKNVNEAMEILTGIKAGGDEKRSFMTVDDDDDGSILSHYYPIGTINYLVDNKLHEFAEMERNFSSSSNNDDSKSDNDTINKKEDEEEKDGR